MAREPRRIKCEFCGNSGLAEPGPPPELPPDHKPGDPLPEETGFFVIMGPFGTRKYSEWGYCEEHMLPELRGDQRLPGGTDHVRPGEPPKRPQPPAPQQVQEGEEGG